MILWKVAYKENCDTREKHSAQESHDMELKFDSDKFRKSLYYGEIKDLVNEIWYKIKRCFKFRLLFFCFVKKYYRGYSFSSYISIIRFLIK